MQGSTRSGRLALDPDSFTHSFVRSCLSTSVLSHCPGHSCASKLARHTSLPLGASAASRTCWEARMTRGTWHGVSPR